MTTRKQDQDFIADMINRTLLDEAVRWIANNLRPEEVFSDADLAEWANDNGYRESE